MAKYDANLSLFQYIKKNPDALELLGDFTREWYRTHEIQNGKLVWVVR